MDWIFQFNIVIVAKLPRQSRSLRWAGWMNEWNECKQSSHRNQMHHIDNEWCRMLCIRMAMDRWDGWGWCHSKEDVDFCFHFRFREYSKNNKFYNQMLLKHAIYKLSICETGTIFILCICHFSLSNIFIFFMIIFIFA